MNNKNSFEEAFINMLSSKRYIDTNFYSFILSKMKVNITKKIPTAGVEIKDKNIILYINDDFFGSLSLDHRIGILIHECNHIIYKHFQRKKGRDHHLFNIASDIALNQTIMQEYLPEGALLPKDFNLKNGQNFPENQTAEQYYNLLKENADSNNINTFETLDDHSMWDEISEEESEILEDYISNIIKEAAERTRGSLPNDIDKILELWSKKPKISWKKELKKYISSIPTSKISTIKKRNRRLRFVGSKGLKKHKDMPQVIVGVDVSGSVSNEEIVNALSEISKLCKVSGTNLSIIQIDTEIKGIEVFSVKKKTFNRKSTGGTYMGKIVPYLKEEKIKYDVLVMISDMEIEDVSADNNWNSHKKPTLWLSTNGYIPEWKSNKHKVIDIKEM